MTETERFLLGLVVTVVVNAVLLGAAWGSMRSGQTRLAQDVHDIRRALGLVDGAEGVFARRAEVEARAHDVDREHQRLHGRISAVEERL
jgi:hypothetical protein